MVNRLDVSYVPPGQKAGRPKTAGEAGSKKAGHEKAGFAQVLEKTMGGGLTFSAHARQRLQARQISLNAADVNKLAQAVEKAAAKGSRASLLLYKDLAFVAGVQNRTIITALDGESRKEHVFTNIDSAVIVK